MRNFGIPEPHKPRIDPSEFDDPFFGGEKKELKPNVYMQLGDERRQQEEVPTATPELSPKELAEILIELDRKMWRDPESELTQEEMSLVYQIDVDLPDVYEEDGGTTYIRNIAEGIKSRRGYPIYDDDMSDEEVRQLHDYEQVKSLIIERLRSEKYVHQTYEALSQVVLGLGLDPAEYDNKAFTNELITKMNEWEERGIFDYLTIELIKNNNRHNIVPVPNKECNAEQIITLAKLFGIKQPYKTWIVDEEYNDGPFYSKYSPAELCGQVYILDQPIRLSLIPSKPNPEFENQTVEEQLVTLQNLQATKPNLNYQIPSVVGSISLWYVLRAHGEILRTEKYTGYNEKIPDKTYVRAFNLPAKKVAGFTIVPFCYVSDEGEPHLYISDITVRFAARSSVG